MLNKSSLSNRERYATWIRWQLVPFPWSLYVPEAHDHEGWCHGVEGRGPEGPLSLPRLPPLPPLPPRLLPHCPFSWLGTQAHPSSAPRFSFPSSPVAQWCTWAAPFKSRGIVQYLCSLAHSWWFIKWMIGLFSLVAYWMDHPPPPPQVEISFFPSA